MEILTDSPTFSPRISFSHDLALYDVVPVEQRHYRSESGSSSSWANPGFEFNIGSNENIHQESCSAEDVFSEGKIIPAAIKKKDPSLNSVQRREDRVHGECVMNSIMDLPAGNKQQSTKEISTTSEGTEEKQKSPNPNKSFWRFKRSTSLNCGSGYGRKLMCPLPLLSRSNSAGSAELPLIRESHHHCQKKLQQMSISTERRHPPVPPQPPPPPKPLQSRLSNGYNLVQHGGLTRRSSGMRASPALNVHSGNLFGLGSIIFNGKDKNRRK